MSRTIHPVSKECALPELGIFAVPCTQGSIDDNNENNLKPAAPIHVSSDFLEFRMTNEAGLYIDGQTVHVILDCQVVDANGAAIADDAPVAPVNNTGHSLFQQCDVYFNGVRVSQPMKTYAYKAHYHTTFGHSEEAKENFLSCVGWKRDDDPSKPNFDRWHGKRSEPFQLVVPLMCDIFMQERYIVSNANIDVKLHRSARSFALHATDGVAYGVNILDATLYYTKFKIADLIFNSHVLAFKHGTAKYPVVYTEVKPYPINSGMSHCSIDNAYHGELPRRLIVAMVDEKAYQGDVNSNPFEFKHNSITNINITYNGRQYPAKPYKMNFKKGMNRKPFYDLFQYTGQLRERDPQLAINVDEYGKGYTYFAFNFTPDLSDASSGHMNLLKRGNMRIELEFENKLQNAIELMLFAEFDRMVEIDLQGNVVSN